MGLEVAWGELRPGSDVLGELGVILADQRGFGDAHVVLSFAIEVSGTSVRILDREELVTLPQANLFFS